MVVQIPASGLRGVHWHPLAPATRGPAGGQLLATSGGPPRAPRRRAGAGRKLCTTAVPGWVIQAFSACSRAASFGSGTLKREHG